MVFLVLSGEQWITDIELVQDTAKAPHVDGRTVRDTQHDLGCPVETWLDVGVDLLVFETATTEVDDLDTWLVDLSQENVLGLEVAMNDTVLVQVVKGDKDLDCESFDKIQRKALEVIHLDELIQVDREHFKCDHEMLPEVELV